MTTETDRRREPRLPVNFEVNYTSDETFLYAYITDISSLGIFVQTDSPLPIGSEIRLGFAPDTPGLENTTRLELEGEVMWNSQGNDNSAPGMGVRFTDVGEKTRARLLAIVRRIAYLADQDD